EKLATAISVYSLGIYLGSALAAKAGGYAVGVLAEMDNMILPLVGEIFAWQLILVAIGIPGLIIALIVLLIKEPKRKGQNADQLIPLSEVWIYLKENGRTFFLICSGAAFFYLAVYAISSWLPTYLMRIHQMSAASVGNVIAIGFGIFPAVGVIGGGRIADYWTKKGVTGAKIKLILWATLLLIPFSTIYPLMPTGKTALIAMIPLCLVLSAPVAATAAAVQEIMPNRMRGVASSILILASNLLGLTIGPTSIALFTDYYFQDEMALGWSLLIVSLISFSIAGIFFYRAFKRTRALQE
ncbi:MAG: MFS transporter, partial [Bacteroidota bacterium]